MKACYKQRSKPASQRPETAWFDVYSLSQPNGGRRPTARTSDKLLPRSSGMLENGCTWRPTSLKPGSSRPPIPTPTWMPRWLQPERPSSKWRSEAPDGGCFRQPERCFALRGLFSEAARQVGTPLYVQPKALVETSNSSIVPSPTFPTVLCGQGQFESQPSKAFPRPRRRL
jgi:hypothetical protein